MKVFFKNILSSKYTTFLVILIVGYVVYNRLSKDEPTKEEKENLDLYLNTPYKKVKGVSKVGRVDTITSYVMVIQPGDASTNVKWSLNKSWVQTQLTVIKNASDPYFGGIGTDEESLINALTIDIKEVVDRVMGQVTFNVELDNVKYNAYTFVLQCYKEAFGLQQYWRIPEDIFNSGQFVNLSEYVGYEVSMYWVNLINDYYADNNFIEAKI